MNIALIVITALIALVIIIKATEVRHHLVYKILGVIAIILAISFIYVWVKSGVSLANYEGFISFGKTYYSWLSSLFGNAKGITSYAAEQGWGLNSSVIPGLE